MKLATGIESVRSRLGHSILRKLLVACTVLIVALPASARGFRGGYYGYGGGFGPWGYGYYDPYFYGSYPVISHPNAGQVKLEIKDKDAEVFINGSFAGTVREMKSMWLRQGTYKLEVRSPGRTEFSNQIYVVNGKTLHVRPSPRS
jgi:hypothetical protein